MTGEHPTQTSLAGDDLKPAWRVACVAYRKVRQSGQLDQPAWLAARAAIQLLRPDLDERAAGAQAAAAVTTRRPFTPSGYGNVIVIRAHAVEVL